MVTKEQIKAARAMLNWNQKTLADNCQGVSVPTIKLIETGRVNSSMSTLGSIKKTLENAGIEFLGKDGVRMRTGEVRTLIGKEGFHEFYDDIYKVAQLSSNQNDGAEFLVNNVDEAIFVKWGAVHGEMHRERMSKLTGIKYKILVREGDYNFVADEYAEYRWLPRGMFSSVPFYVYGDKLAILLLQQSEPVILVMNYAAVTEAYRRQFSSIWDQAIIPPVREGGETRKSAAK